MTNQQELCVCGHPRSRHADPSGGDTGCLAIEHPADLVDTFDDGKERADLAYCGCLAFRTLKRWEREVEEYNRRALMGDMGEPVPEQIICPLGGNVCDDYRCRAWGCLDQRLGHAERQD
jgi:hypothetical protein